MARYVVLHFDDNEVAEEFTTDNSEPLPYGAYEIVALIPAPTLFCQGGHGVKKTTGGWFRGKKYGWWVCAVCGKPSKAWGSSYAAVCSAGYNLLNEDQEEPPRGWSQEQDSSVPEV